MDKLAALHHLVTTVNAGGFSAAARQLGVATSSVTRTLDALEAELDVVLLNRSTRQVTLTEAGKRYYDQALEILEAVAEADAGVRTDQQLLEGPLHVSLPVEFGRHVVLPGLAGFLRQYPGMELTLTLSDEVVDLLDARVDLSIRLGNVLRSDEVVMRDIGAFERWLVASPEYLHHQGTPLSPDDLASHACLRLDSGQHPRPWRFERDGEQQEITVHGPLRSNNADALLQAALGGSGIALLGDWLLHEALESGRLVRLLRYYRINPGQASSRINALYLPSQRRSARIAAFLDFVRAHLG